MPVIYSNNASTTLSAGINDSTTTIGIASASGFPSISGSNYYFATIANTNNTKIEVVKVTAGTTSLTVTRAQDGTTAQAFDSGDNFQLRVTAATLEAATKTDVNITGGAIAGAAITNDVIDSQHYAAGSIDLEHMSSASVDEDNLVISNAGSDGQYLQKQSGNTGGLTWATVDTTTLLPLAGGAMTGAITTNSTFDGVDIATRDAILTSTTTTAGAALPKAGGAMTGAITTNSTFDGRDVATDGTKLDGIASSANNYVHPNHSGEVTSTADGATVIAGDVVDEANLKVSNAPTNGYFLSAQSGNTGGLTWAEVSSEDFIPDGSVMAFFQSSAPTGWTQVTTQNDKVLRVVSGTGGGTGGTWATSSGVTSSEVAAHTHTSAAHTHTGAAHTHTGAAHTHGGGNLAAAATSLSTAQMPSHTHSLGLYGSTNNQNNSSAGANGGASMRYSGASGSGSTHSHGMSGNTASTTPGATGSTTPGAGGSTTPGDTGSANAHSHTISAPQYIDVIICSKDA